MQSNHMSVVLQLGKLELDNEIVPVAVTQRRGDDIIVSQDEEYTNVKWSITPLFSLQKMEQLQLQMRRL
jgi:DNA-directed RNA polymerase alpha subunit